MSSKQDLVRMKPIKNARYKRKDYLIGKTITL